MKIAGWCFVIFKAFPPIYFDLCDFAIREKHNISNPGIS